MSTYDSIEYNIPGYVPYTKTGKIINLKKSENSKQIQESTDYFQINEFTIIFFLTNLFIKLGLWILGSIPVINILSFIMTSLIDGFTQTLILSFLITLYIGMKRGHNKRNIEHNNILHNPNIQITIIWENDIIYKIPYSYTPDIYEKMPKDINDLKTTYSQIIYQKTGVCITMICDKVLIVGNGLIRYIEYRK